MRRSYRTLSALLAALLCAAPALAADSAAPTAAPIPTALTASAAQGGALHLDLSRDLAGFAPLLADYPQGEEAFYELDVSRQPIPIAGAGFGLRLTGNNHSDDLFLGAYRLLEGLPPETPCVFTVTLRIATDVDGGLVGIGGSPGSSVFFKCGITAAKPRREVVDGSYRLTLDKGNQGQDGPDMALIGNLEKDDAKAPGQYEWKTLTCRLSAAPDALGRAYLSFGIDSGFEGLSRYYVESIDISWDIDQPLTRAAAIQALWEAKGRPAGEAPPFPDAADTPVLAWARSQGITLGYADGSFRPEEALSFQQALLLLYRAAGSPEVYWAPAIPGLAPQAESAAAWALDQELFRLRELSAPAAPIPEAVFRQTLPGA